MSIITAVKNGDRLHLGYGQEDSMSKNLGTSIKTYQNFITKFFSKLFGLSIDIEIAGKNRIVEKKSFKLHLQSIGLGNVSVDEVGKLGYRTILERNHTDLKISTERFGEDLSDKKRMKLYGKMVAQLEANNTQAVMKLLRKGAYLDREFFKVNGKLFYSKQKVEEFLIDNRIRETSEVYSYTPLASAAEKGNAALARFIFVAKGHECSSDKKRKFNYSYAGSDRFRINELGADDVHMHDHQAFLR